MMARTTYGLMCVLIVSLMVSSVLASEQQDLALGDTSSGLWNTEQMGPISPKHFVKRSNLYALFKKLNYEANRRKLYNEMVKKSDFDYFY